MPDHRFGIPFIISLHCISIYYTDVSQLSETTTYKSSCTFIVEALLS